VDDFDTEAALTMPANLVSTTMLERHLDWIGRDHDFVSLDDLGERLAAGTSIRRPLAAVTFDDGYRDVYENAIPMLRRKGIPAACFLVADLLGTQELQAHDRVHELMRRGVAKWQRPAATLRRRLETAQVPEIARFSIPETRNPYLLTRVLLTRLSSRSRDLVIAFLEDELGSMDMMPEGFLPMTWDMVLDIDRAGFVVGSHTRRHVLLSNESRPCIYDEVVESKRALETQLGHPVTHFAYPDGSFNCTAIKAVQTAGYRFAYTGCEHRDHRNPLMTIPRRVLWEHSAVDMRGQFAPALLRCQERGWLLGRRSCSWQSHA